MTEGKFNPDEIRKIADDDLLKTSGHIESGTRRVELTFDTALNVIKELTRGKKKNFSDLSRIEQQSLAKAISFLDEMALNYASDITLGIRVLPKKKGVNPAERAETVREKIRKFASTLEGVSEFFSQEEKHRLGFVVESNAGRGSSSSKTNTEKLKNTDIEGINKIAKFIDIEKILVTGQDEFSVGDLAHVLRHSRRVIDSLRGRGLTPKTVPLDEKRQLLSVLSYIVRAQNRIQNKLIDVTDARVRNGVIDGVLTKAILIEENAGKIDETRPEIFVKRKDYDTASQYLWKLQESFQSLINDFKPFLTEKEQQDSHIKEGRKGVDLMDIDEIIDELSNAIIATDRLAELNERYFVLIGQEKDAKRNAWYRTRRGLQAISVSGYTGASRFDIFFDKITEELADKSVEFTHLARALFIKEPEKKTGKNGEATAEDMNSAEINMQAIGVYDFIIDMLKSTPENGGFNPGPDKNRFSYVTLKSDDEIKKFIEMIKGTFLTAKKDENGNVISYSIKKKYGDLTESLVDEIIKYTQVMAGMSVAYIPWMLRATTRFHGGDLAGIRKQDFVDEITACNFFAWAHYSRERYGDSIENETTEDYLFFMEDVIENIFSKDQDAKIEHAKEVAEDVVSYREMTWNEIPDWVDDLRELIDVSERNEDGTWRHEVTDDMIDLNESIFPLPCEVVINALKIEQESRDLLKLPQKTRQQKTERTKRLNEFLEKCEKLGYITDTFNKKKLTTEKRIKGIGLEVLSSISMGQYQAIARPAMEKMADAFFKDAPDQFLMAEEAKDHFKDWIDKIIGKAKLIPGRHWLLFGPYTMRFIQMQLGYANAADKMTGAKEITAALMNELLKAGGVPSIVKEYVADKLLHPPYDTKESVKELAGNKSVRVEMVAAPKYLIRSGNEGKKFAYLDRKANAVRRFRNGLDNIKLSVSSRILSLMGLSKKDVDGMTIDDGAFWKGKASKDTRESAD